MDPMPTHYESNELSKHNCTIGHHTTCKNIPISTLPFIIIVIECTPINRVGNAY